MDKPRVLLVDDNAADLLALRTSLEVLDIEVIAVDSGNAGLPLIIAEDFALLLFSVDLADMSYVELTGLLDSTEKTRCLPVIFLSSVQAGEDELLEAYRAGAVDYLVKSAPSLILSAKVKVFTDLQIRYQTLTEKVERVKTLQGILTACMHCRKISKDADHWSELDIYLREHTEVQFSHGVCPECMNERYPELDDSADQENKGSG